MLNAQYLAVALTVCVLMPGDDAGAQPVRVQVEQFAPLLLSALQAQDGRARGVLVGSLAMAIGQQYGTSAPIEIDVSTVVRYAQQGCARLRVDVSQQGLKFAAPATPQRQDIRFELNYCGDGLPPRSLALREAP